MWNFTFCYVQHINILDFCGSRLILGTSTVQGDERQSCPTVLAEEIKTNALTKLHCISEITQKRECFRKLKVRPNWWYFSWKLQLFPEEKDFHFSIPGSPMKYLVSLVGWFVGLVWFSFIFLTLFLTQVSQIRYCCLRTHSAMFYSEWLVMIITLRKQR